MKLAYKCDGYNKFEEVKTKIVLDESISYFRNKVRTKLISAPCGRFPWGTASISSSLCSSGAFSSCYSHWSRRLALQSNVTCL